jgi:hypothetical protein
VPVVLGALAGLFGLPIVLVAVIAAWAPLSILVLAAVLALATLGLTRTRGGVQRWSGRLWRLVAWTSLAAVLGLLIGFTTSVLCVTDTECGVQGLVDPQRPLLTVLVFGASFLGSIAIAIGVDRAARRLAGMR